MFEPAPAVVAPAPAHELISADNPAVEPVVMAYSKKSKKVAAAA
jgi:hypothetical protein